MGSWIDGFLEISDITKGTEQTRPKKGDQDATVELPPSAIRGSMVWTNRRVVDTFGGQHGLNWSSVQETFRSQGGRARVDKRLGRAPFWTVNALGDFRNVFHKHYCNS